MSYQPPSEKWRLSKIFGSLTQKGLSVAHSPYDWGEPE